MVQVSKNFKLRVKWTRCIREGAAAVEFAVIAGPLFLCILASLEISRGMMSMESMEEAARAGCRVAILRGATTDEIRSAVDRVLDPARIKNFAVQVEPADLAAADRWSPITVTVTASYDAMTWLPMPRYLRGKSFTASSTFPKEYDNGQ